MYFSKISLISLQEHRPFGPIFSPLIIFFGGNLSTQKKENDSDSFNPSFAILPLNTTLQSLLLRITKVVLNFSRFKPRGPQLKPVFGGFETRLKFIKFVHRPH